MNPIANTAVFVALTGNEDKSVQKQTAFKALLLTFFIILSFSILGNAVFQLFGITLSALRITGGILVFIIGYQMLHGENSKMHNTIDNGDSSIAISPLAVPILAGPGTIATAMNYSATGNVSEIVITLSAFSILCLFTYFCFIFGQRLVQLIGISGISIVTRLMGLILAVIGVQMFLQGIFGALSDYTSLVIKT